jgi:hypothetical protein
MELTEELRNKILGMITNSEQFKESNISIDEINEIIDDEYSSFKSGEYNGIEWDNDSKGVLLEKKLTTLSKAINKKLEYKLYRVSVSYFKEEIPKSQSSGGCTSYVISALSPKNADKIGLDVFNEEHKEYSFDGISVKSSIINLPTFVKLSDEGIINL